MTTTPVISFARVWRERIDRLTASNNPAALGIALRFGELVAGEAPDALVVFDLTDTELGWFLGAVA